MHQQQTVTHTHTQPYETKTVHEIHMKNDRTDRKQLEKSMAAFGVGFVCLYKDIYANSAEMGINLRKSHTYHYTCNDHNRRVFSMEFIFLFVLFFAVERNLQLTVIKS